MTNSVAPFMEDTTTKREAIYSRFEAFEERLAHCYFLLQERFISEPALSRFWAEAALEELQHQSMLRFCRERRFMANVHLDDKTADEIEALMDTIASILGDPGVSVDDAFYAAQLIESSELEEAYGELTSGLAKDHPILYQAIHASLRSHHERFAEAAEAFCGDRRFIGGFRDIGKILS